MSEDIESTLTVCKISDVHTDERKIAVVLKGQKTVTHTQDGYDTEDIVDIEVKLMFRRMLTAEVLRVNLVGLAKLLELSARDSLLSDFQANFQAGTKRNSKCELSELEV